MAAGADKGEVAGSSDLDMGDFASKRDEMMIRNQQQEKERGGRAYGY